MNMKIIYKEKSVVVNLLHIDSKNHPLGGKIVELHDNSSYFSLYDHYVKVLQHKFLSPEEWILLSCQENINIYDVKDYASCDLLNKLMSGLAKLSSFITDFILTNGKSPYVKQQQDYPNWVHEEGWVHFSY